MNKTQMQLNIPVIKATGYVYVYLSYENDGTNWVYFDDLKVSYKKSPVVQNNNYYAFGLSAESWTRFDTKPNKYLYNAGSELNDKTGSYEMFFRSYDPAIGRMSGVDVMASSYATLTPYQYANNNPVTFNDPTGAWSSEYERASNGGCGCWRDKGPQDGGGGGVDYNLATYGSPSIGGSAFGTMGVAPNNNTGMLEAMNDVANLKDGTISQRQYEETYGTTYEIWEVWMDYTTNGREDGSAFIGYRLKPVGTTRETGPGDPDKWTYAGFGISGVPFFAVSWDGGKTYKTSGFTYTKNEHGVYIKTENRRGFFPPFWGTYMGRDIIEAFPILGPEKNRDGIGNIIEQTFWDGLLDPWWPVKVPVFLPDDWEKPAPPLLIIPK